MNALREPVHTDPDAIKTLAGWNKGGEVRFANRSRTPNARTERPVRFRFGLGAEPFGAFGFGVRWIPKFSEPIRTGSNRSEPNRHGAEPRPVLAFSETMVRCTSAVGSMHPSNSALERCRRRLGALPRHPELYYLH